MRLVLHPVTHDGLKTDTGFGVTPRKKPLDENPAIFSAGDESRGFTHIQGNSDKPGRSVELLLVLAPA